jgi:hypothetical protein
VLWQALLMVVWSGAAKILGRLLARQWQKDAAALGHHRPVGRDGSTKNLSETVLLEPADLEDFLDALQMYGQRPWDRLHGSGR